jgi:hypothetical protein
MKKKYNGREVEIIKTVEKDGLIFYEIRLGDIYMTVQDKYVEEKDD